MNKSDYVDAHKLLSDTRYYEKLANDPTDEITKEVTHAIVELYEHRHIDKDTHDFLTPADPKPGRFYILPKIHKPDIP